MNALFPVTCSKTRGKENGVIRFLHTLFSGSEYHSVQRSMKLDVSFRKEVQPSPYSTFPLQSQGK